MTETMAQDSSETLPVRIVVQPVRLGGKLPSLPEGRRIHCKVAVDCDDLNLRDWHEVIVVLDRDAADLPQEMLDTLRRREIPWDDEHMMAFEGCRDIGEFGGRRVIAARSWGDRRPSEELAEAAIAAFLAEKLGEEDVPFKLCEDGDGNSAPNKCGWAFWITDSDTTSYLKENLQVEWYGTSYDPDGPEPDEDDEDTENEGALAP